MIHFFAFLEEYDIIPNVNFCKKYERENEKVMGLLKLLGILIVVIGFVLKLDSILIIMIAAIVTALVAGMDPVTFLETLGSSFVANRSMCVFVMVMVVTGTLERNGLKQAAANLMKKFKNASAGVVLAIYGVFRLVFAAFNVSFGGVAGFVRPIVMPMATAAAKKNDKKISEKYEENLKGMASGMENIAWFFGQVLFVGTSGMILVQSTLASLGYDVELVDLMKVQIPVAIIAVGIAIVYYYLKDKQLSRKETK